MSWSATSTCFLNLQGWGLNHCPGQPGPMPDHSFCKDIFPNILSKPPLTQLEAIASCPIASGSSWGHATICAALRVKAASGSRSRSKGHFSKPTTHMCFCLMRNSSLVRGLGEWVVSSVRAPVAAATRSSSVEEWEIQIPLSKPLPTSICKAVEHFFLTNADAEN